MLGSQPECVFKHIVNYFIFPSHSPQALLLLQHPVTVVPRLKRLMTLLLLVLPHLTLSSLNLNGLKTFLAAVMNMRCMT